MILIDAEPLLQELNRGDFDTYKDYSRAFDLIDNAPTVEADRPKGKWIGSECSVCHDDLMNYQYELPSIECGFCPFCGADMRDI